MTTTAQINTAVVAEGSGLFASIAGLPLHPLVVHLAIVVLPASALALIAIVAVPRWRRAYGWLCVAAALLGSGGAFLAKESGESLAAQVGMPVAHAAWGDRLFVAAVIFSVVTVLWFVLDVRSRAQQKVLEATSTYLSPSEPSVDVGHSWLSRLAGGAVVLLSVVVLGLTVLTGHTGATAVWGATNTELSSAPAAGTDAPLPSAEPSNSTASASPSPKASTSAKGAPSSATPQSTTGSRSYTLTQVKGHASARSCWAAIDGNVYDLTKWVSQHPGGSADILGICGTDASSAFHAEHGRQPKPARELAGFQVGTLA